MSTLYLSPTVEEPVSQGDILDGCPVFGLDVSVTGVDLAAAPARWSERVVVLIQACDLTQARTTKILVALVHPAQLLAERGVLKAPTIRDQVRRGLVYGWYFLPAAPAPIPLPESIIRSPRPAHGAPSCPGALDRQREKSMPFASALPRTFGAAFCGYVHANRVARTVHD
jgi:hypothetical protein